MKKILSIILSVSMILTLAAAMGLTVAATPEGTAINNAAEFAAMTADGTYYLAADITIDATWNAGQPVSATYKDNTAFTGTLDGNGHTVTISAPLFANLAGTVKNLKTKGELAASELHAGNIAMWTNGTVVIDNVITSATVPSGSTSAGVLGYAATGSNVTITNSVNYADVTCTGQAGGIIGYCQDNELTVTNCANYGKITTANYGAGIAGRFGRDAAKAPGSKTVISQCTNYGDVVSAKGQSGGILGYLVGDATIDHCVNYGNIVNESAIAGGIYGSSRNVKNNVNILIKNCVNYGAVTGKTRVGGIAGTLGMEENHTSFRIENCINYGTVTNVAASGYSSNFQTGGIAGYAYGGNKETPNGIINCINVGDIIIDATLAVDDATVQVAGIVPYVNALNWEGKNNVNLGTFTISGTVDAKALVLYNKNAEPINISGNYSVATEGIPVILFGSPAEENTTAATVITVDKLESEVLPAVNTAAGATIYEMKDGKPALVCDHGFYIEAIEAEAPTCVEAGHEAGTICSACGHIVSGCGEIAATGNHTFVEGVCKDCGEADPNYVPPADTTEPGQSGDTGDTAWIYLAFAAVAVLGTAIVAKKREN